MTTPPSPERHSLYPEPHRVGDWPEPARHRSRPPVVPLLIAFAGVAVLLTLAIHLGLTYGKSHGTETVVVNDPSGQEINAIQAQPGTCLKDVPPDGLVAQVTAVPCSTAHRAEVVATYPVSGDAWPGRQVVEDEVLGYCGAVIQPGFDAGSMFRTSDWEDGLRWVAWLPTEKSWQANERSGLCIAYRDGDIMGSFVARTATFSN